MQEYAYGHMVQEYYVKRVREISRERDAVRNAIRTKSQVLDLRKEVREKLRKSFGKFPPKTPLNARTTGIVERKNYIIEKVIYESRPDLLVTGNLYIPKKRSGRYPAVLGSCGHSMDGKASKAYQSFSQGLAQKGFAVLIYDPLSQGERRQYWECKNYMGCCREHNFMDRQLSLLGEFFGMWRLWDGIRGLDYLLSRPEVDAGRVGVTGCSGGGTLTTYLNAFDDRFAMAAPSCFVSNYLSNMENELPSDAEQMPPDILKLGLDHADFFIAQIPRPVILLGQKDDFFDPRGLKKTYAELKRLYTIAGYADNIQLHIGWHGHGYQQESREAMYGFFSRHAGIRTGKKEATLHVEKEKTLFATPSGQVWKEKSKRVFDFISETAGELRNNRSLVKPASLKNHLLKTLNLSNRPEVPHFRVLRETAISGHPNYTRHIRYAVETEPGIQAILHFFHASKEYEYFHFPQEKSATVYIPHLSTWQEVVSERIRLHEPRLFSVDVRSIGQSTALTCDQKDFFDLYDADYFYASHSQMLGESYLGKKVYDLLRVLDIFKSQRYREVHLIGKGMGSLYAAFAACLHPIVKRVTLINPPLSYFELTQKPLCWWPLSALPFGILKHFDLPDCYRALYKKSLRIIEPWDNRMKSWEKTKLREHCKKLGIDQNFVRK